MESTIDIICPLYNAEKYVYKLHENIKKQKNVSINSINYILTKGNDNTENILKELDCNYEVISKEEFSHSTVRENVARKCNGDILVFITQDIIIEREDWLVNLTKCIENEECEAAYSRQTCSNNTIEKYTRERNYPKESFIVSKDDIEKKGLQTFFFSDASSAIKRDIFMELNCYDGKRFPTNEDMYIAYKLITNGYKIKYCADSIVEHSHKFTFKQLYKRYYDTGIFFKKNSYLNKYKVNQAGGGMALYILKRALQDKNLTVLVEFVPNMAARFIGMKAGKHLNKHKTNKTNISNIIISLFAFIISMLLYYSKLNHISAVILMITGMILFFVNKKEEGYYTNPIGVFSIVWFFTIGLSNLRLHQNQVEWKYETWICLILTYIAFNIGYIIGKKRNKKLSRNEMEMSKKNNFVFITLLFFVSLLAFGLEVAIRGYVPAFSTNMSAYQDFSVTGIHYFTVSCALILPLTYIYYTTYRRSINAIEILYLICINIIALTIPLLIVSRQLILAAFALTGFAIMKKNKNKEIIILILIMILGLLAWNLISGFRNQNEAYLRQALNIQKDAPLSVNNMQIYMYATMNFDNFNCNVNELSQYYYGTRSIFPVFAFTGIKFVEPFFTDVTSVAERIIPVYNTYPIVATPYFDFGYIGIIIYMVIVGYLSFLVEKRDDGDIINGLTNVLFKYALLFSFFVAYFSNPTWWFYVIIGIAGKVCISKLNNKQNA